MLRSDLCDLSDAYIVVKGTITVTKSDNAKRNKRASFKKKMHHLSTAVQKSMAYKLTTLEIQTFCLEISAGILNLLNTRQVLQEILIMVMMMQTKSLKMELKLLFH